MAIFRRVSYALLIQKINSTYSTCSKSCFLTEYIVDSQYDVGGPLVCYGDLTGVLSWVDPDCNDCYPEVFSRVSSHREWINATLRLSGVRLDELP